MLLVVVLPLAVTAAIGAWPTAPAPVPAAPAPVASQAAGGAVDPPAAEPVPAPVEPPPPVVDPRAGVNPLRPATSRLRVPGSAAASGARAAVTVTVERRLGLAPTVVAPTVTAPTGDRSDDASDVDDGRDEPDVDRDRRCPRYPLGAVRRGSSCADNGSCRSEFWVARRGPCSGVVRPAICAPRSYIGAFYYGDRSRFCGPDYGSSQCYSAYGWPYCGITWPGIRPFPYPPFPIWWGTGPFYNGPFPICSPFFCRGRSREPYVAFTDAGVSSPLVPDVPIVEATPVPDVPEAATGGDPVTVGTPIEETPPTAVPPVDLAPVDPAPVDPAPSDPAPSDPLPVDPLPAVPDPTGPTPPDPRGVVGDPVPAPPIDQRPEPEPEPVPVPVPVDPPDVPAVPLPPVVDPPEPPEEPTTDPEPPESEPEELTAPEDEAADPVVENEQPEDR